MNTTAKWVACTPFENPETKTDVKGGLVFITQKNELSKHKVVFDNHDRNLFGSGGGESYSAGDTVWVRGEMFKHQFAKEIFEVEGKKFILIPTDLILVKRRETEDYREEVKAE
jgi:hypothetical protein